MNYAKLHELVTIANELDQRGLVKEAGRLDGLIAKGLDNNGEFVKTAAWWWVLHAAWGAAAALLAGREFSTGEKTVWAHVGVNPTKIQDGEYHPDDLFEWWKDGLKTWDLSYDWDDFPKDHPKRNQFAARWNSNYNGNIRDMADGANTEDYVAFSFTEGTFQDAASNDAGFTFMGTMNCETCWVESFETLVMYKNSVLETIEAAR